MSDIGVGQPIVPYYNIYGGHFTWEHPGGSPVFCRGRGIQLQQMIFLPLPVSISVFGWNGNGWTLLYNKVALDHPLTTIYLQNYHYYGKVETGSTIAPIKFTVFTNFIGTKSVQYWSGFYLGQNDPGPSAIGAYRGSKILASHTNRLLEKN